MRKLFLSLLSLVLLWGRANVRAGENLVPNPGFEAPSQASGKPGGGWWLYVNKGDPVLKVDMVVSRSGKASARVQATNDVKCTVVSAPFAVAPEIGRASCRERV